MLTNKNYSKGIMAYEQSKYNVQYDKKLLFDVVCANLAHKVLTQSFVELTNEEREKLEHLINK
jgi:hypothetical protein